MSGNAAVLARKLLLGQRLYNLVIDPEKLRYDRKILFSSYGDFCRKTTMCLSELTSSSGLNDGCTIISRDSASKRYIVLYNENQRYLSRRRFTLAHEIGHIYLNHIDDGYKNETEANIFASEFLMPSVLVRRIYKLSGQKAGADELSSMFGVSLSAAGASLSRALKDARTGSYLYDGDILQKYHHLITAATEYFEDI